MLKKHIIGTLCSAVFLLGCVLFLAWSVPTYGFPEMLLPDGSQAASTRGRWGVSLPSGGSFFDSTFDQLPRIKVDPIETNISLEWVGRTPSEADAVFFALPDRPLMALGAYTSNPDVVWVEAEVALKQGESPIILPENLAPGTYLVVVNCRWTRLWWEQWGTGSYGFLLENS